MNDLLKVVAIKKEEEDRFIIVCGNQQAKLIEFETREEAEMYLEQNFNVDCDILMTVIHVMFEIHEKMKEKNENKISDNRDDDSNS